ncbi:MAG: sodium/proline symporter, partial [Cyanobacteria bacterium P01_A01_bin.17]
SATQKQGTTADYLLASRSVNPWLTGLSAFATAHSGGMFISTIGYTYTAGISSVWLLVGWFLGDYLTWFFIHKRLRLRSAEAGADTFGSFLGAIAKGEKPNRAIASLSALITLAFLGCYAAAQLLAGSKALHVVFGWDYSIGIILGAIIVVLYCFSGGIRASIWTDAVQSIVMMGAMFLLMGIALAACGGFGGMWAQLQGLDPALVDPVPKDLQFGFALFLLSWLMGGVGVVGQPHIMVRAMVLKSSEQMGISRNIYAGLYVIFSTAAVITGLTARVLVPGLLDGGDPELALPLMATELLPGLLVGLILAGVFAAVISTADSQILSCSAALTQDLFPQWAGSYRWAKRATVISAGLIVAIALSSNKNMFALGVFAWSALACGLGPLLMVRVFALPVSPAVGVAMMTTGVAVAAIWNAVLKFSGSVYEVLPGMLAGGAVYLLAWLWKRQHVQESKI